MLNIAITGGIGAGKSCVTSYLTEKGYTVIDADKMSREMTAAGGKAMPYILEHFGPGFINEDGSLNRAAMRDLVFREPKYMPILEAGTTAVVIEDIDAIRKEEEQRGTKVLFYDIPLLFEKHKEDEYDRVWVVTADRNLKAERIMKRDKIDPSIIDLIIESQADDDFRISKADVVFYNNGTIEELHDLVDAELSKI
ncbi:MAG: dephospho-CoA kinase [Mogibacterium sp.]|nr:dephospho-CoA kinase [Mogibacterium sp.]